MGIRIVPISDAKRRKDTVSKVKKTAADDRRLERIKRKRDKEAREIAADRRFWREKYKKSAKSRLRPMPSSEDLQYESRMEAGLIEGEYPEEVGSGHGGTVVSEKYLKRNDGGMASKTRRF